MIARCYTTFFRAENIKLIPSYGKVSQVYNTYSYIDGWWLTGFLNHENATDKILKTF